ncbi:DUF4440 domain-containing protein [Streptomyces sp. NPDC048111]|uniref:nuclear transport factor 2 family protein n=1 Tax=Streptomyces sp. NPDC048111 TaxID=3365500 RepID=UPI00371ABDFE
MPESEGRAVEAAVEGELRLLDPEVRASAELLAAQLHPDYVEFGRSGRRWNRAEIIAALTAEDARVARPITASGMTGVRLAPDVVHLTFDTDNNGRLAHRSSLWRRTDDGWLLYFHQATPFTALPSDPLPQDG